MLLQFANDPYLNCHGVRPIVHFQCCSPTRKADLEKCRYDAGSSNNAINTPMKTVRVLFFQNSLFINNLKHNKTFCSYQF
ncbi:hypothetical protein A359_01820 [secondary endosymbiont of Ctenarytaina eucalypti]|uniref:Uncharacterized protein n=1 Tax=secondary endosymbiont of Ctenarytaina eucalypti TaxID=1199245 RepID=J3Z2Z2_9ENTR|nr:hypothetical protein A359_01820 [secondary endosymbiont of Ctenarytaina eucalypti]